MGLGAFVFIDAGPCSDRPEFFCAYAGPRWYSLALVQWILEQQVQNGAGMPIARQHFGPVFRASRSISRKELEVVFDRMRAAIEVGLQETGNYTRPYASALPKPCLLSMLGRWNTKIAKAWQRCEVKTRDDAPAVVHKERQLDDELTKYMTQHSALSNSTMVLFSLVALNQEHLSHPASTAMPASNPRDDRRLRPGEWITGADGPSAD